MMGSWPVNRIAMRRKRFPPAIKTRAIAITKPRLTGTGDPKLREPALVGCVSLTLVISYFHGYAWYTDPV
jgi:hypothetical protein